jgi:CRISPR/Cas system CMR-associated protein Cmr3 (group 5 of RAMP superfamily)
MTNAHFVYEYDGKIQGLFENDYITEQTLSRIKLPHVSTIEYLKRVIVASDLNLFKKDNPITLDFDSLYDVFPEQINTEQIIQRIGFKLKSKPIELIDLKKQNVTFSNHEKNIVNIDIPNNYKLYKN